MTAVTAKPGTDPGAAAERRATHSTEVVADRRVEFETAREKLTTARAAVRLAQA